MKLPEPFLKQNSYYVNAVIETPRGSRNKYDYRPLLGLFQLSKVLPAGTSFPLDFGFIPHTLGADGDPLDILVLTDAPAYMGCLIECRVIGVFEVEQTEVDGTKYRNDRILGVACPSLDHGDIKDIKTVNKNLISELVHFFEYYNSMAGKKFKLLGTRGPKEAIGLIKANVTT